jgi:flagellin
VSDPQSSSGALLNRMNSIVSRLEESSENIAASRSRILDADYGPETVILAKSLIVQLAATAMLTQANQNQDSVLSLLQ